MFGIHSAFQWPRWLTVWALRDPSYFSRRFRTVPRRHRRRKYPAPSVRNLTGWFPAPHQVEEFGNSGAPKTETKRADLITVIANSCLTSP